MKLPDDIIRQELLPYLTVHDIVKLDNACRNRKYRTELLQKINGVILLGDKDKSMKASLFQWLGMRRIYLMKILIEIHSIVSSLEKYYVDQFRFLQHALMRGNIRDDMAIFIISHCPSLLSIETSCNYYCNQVTDRTLQSIAEHCTGLQSLI